MPKKKNFLGGMQNYNPKNGEYESRLTKADGTPATKENMPGGEEDKKSFKSFGKKKDYQSVLRKWGYDPDDKLTEKQIDDVIAQLEKEQDISDAIKGQNGKLYSRKSGVEIKEGMNDEIINAFKEKKKSFSKKEIKPTDYEGVEETPYGYIYNVGNTSITDLKAERKSMGMGVDENKEYGYTVFKDGEEIYYSTFEEAYNSAKRNDLSVDDDTFERINNARMGKTTKEQPSKTKEASADDYYDRIDELKRDYSTQFIDDREFAEGIETIRKEVEQNKGSFKEEDYDRLQRIIKREIPRPEWAKKIDAEFEPVFEKARKQAAETESRLKKLAKKSGIDYNELKNAYIDRLDKVMKEKRFREEELGETALDLLEEDINSKIANDESKNAEKERIKYIDNKVISMIKEGKSNYQIKKWLEENDDSGEFDWYEADGYIESMREEHEN